MTPKKKKELMHLLYCVNCIQLEVLDELHPTTPQMVKYKADIIGFNELLINAVADTATIQKSTYFQTLMNQIYTVIRKNFNPEM